MSATAVPLPDGLGGESGPVGTTAVRRRPGMSLVIGAAIVVLVAAMAVVSFVWTPHDPGYVNSAARLRDVGDPVYWLGTDKWGRDVVSQLLVGARATLFVGIVAVGIAGVIGVPLGLVGAMAPRWVGEPLMRSLDLLLAFPALLLAIMLSAVYGGSTLVAMLAIGIASVPNFARVVRSGALQVLHTEYVLAARAAGRRPIAIGWHHVLPSLDLSWGCGSGG